MKKALSAVLGIIIVVMLLSLSKDVLIKTSVEKGVEAVTGLRLKIQDFKVGILNSSVGVKNLRLHNPAGFPDRIMLDMPEIYVDYNLLSILKGTIHLEELRIDAREFVVVKNKNGALNLDSLKVVRAQKEGKSPREKEASGGKAPEIRIDLLKLKIGKVIYKDYSKGRTPSVRQFNINLDERYKNITDPYSLVSLIVVKALAKTSIANLTNFDLAGLRGTVSDTLATAQKVAVKAAQQARETIKKTSQVTKKAVSKTAKKTQEAVKETAETLKKTTEGLKDVLTNPFGAKKE